jgi:hypothetical protein
VQLLKKLTLANIWRKLPTIVDAYFVASDVVSAEILELTDSSLHAGELIVRDSQVFESRREVD